MGTENITSWTNLLKILFLPGNVTESLRDNFLLYQWLTDIAQVVPFGGLRAEFPVKDQRQAGVGFLEAGAGSLPTPTVSNALKATFNVAWTYGVGEFDDMAMKVSRSDTLAYQQVEDQVVEDLLTSLKMILNAAWYGDGPCKMGSLPAADEGPTVTLLQPIHLMKGMRVDEIDATDNFTKLQDSVSITNVDHQGVATNLLHGTITHDGSASVGAATDDYFVPEDAIKSDGTRRGPYGLLAGCTDGNPTLDSYGELDRTAAANASWKGNRVHNSGINTAWTARRANALLQLISRRSSGMVDLSDVRIINNRNIAQEIFESVAPDKQITVTGDEALTVTPGFKGGSGQSFTHYARLNGVNPMFQDDMSTENKQFFVSPRTWHILQTNPPELVDEDGSPLHRLETRPAWQFRYRYPHQVYTTAPAANGVLDDVRETNPLS